MLLNVTFLINRIHIFRNKENLFKNKKYKKKKELKKNQTESYIVHGPTKMELNQFDIFINCEVGAEK